jgi:hypothetical protein
MKLPVIETLCIVALSGTISAAYADEGKDESGKGREIGRYSFEKDRRHERSRHDDHWEDDNRGSYFHEHGYTHLEIPPGHYPPPGECRIWYPDRPAGHQPPPGDCGRVPPGAWVIHHPRDLPGRVHVNVYEPDYPDRGYIIGEFDIGSGQFIRIILQD